MQSNANELDREREERLELIEERDRREREADERARERSGKFGGGKGEFVSGLQRKAGELGLDERIRRGAKGFERVGRDED